MSVTLHDLAQVARRLAESSLDGLTITLETGGDIRVESYSDHHAAAQSYLQSLGSEVRWSQAVLLDDGSEWRRLSTVVDGVTFCTFDCRPAAAVKVAA